MPNYKFGTAALTKGLEYFSHCSAKQQRSSAVCPPSFLFEVTLHDAVSISPDTERGRQTETERQTHRDREEASETRTV